MASVAKGTYIIHSVYNTNLVIDSIGAKDQANANVAFHTYNATDAQYVRVYNMTSGSNSWQELSFPATGNVIDVKGGKFAQGTNVQQYPRNKTAAQRWKTVATGDTVTYDGSSYPIYKIYCHSTYDSSSSTNWLLEGNDVATASSGTNICIAADESTSKDQMWIFVPANPVPTGTYEIVSALDPGKCLDLQGGSDGNGAHVIIYDRNDGNNQKLWLTLYDDNGRSKLVFVHSMKVMETLNTNAAKSGDIVCQCTDYGQTDQRWVLEPSDDLIKVDGVEYPAYQISNYATSGTTLCVDVKNGQTTNGNEVRLYAMNESNAQHFAFVPTEALEKGLPTPSKVGFYVGSKLYTSGNAKGSSAKFGFTCAGKKFQARYRYRTGTASATGVRWGSWTSYLSIYTGTSGNDGWGTAWKPNLTFTSSSSAKSASIPTMPTPTVTTLVQLQGQARSFASDYDGNVGLYSHGNSGASGTVTVGLAPTLTITGVEATEDGLEVAYESDWTGGGCSVTVSSLVIGGVSVLSTSRVSSGLDGSEGSAIVPWEAFALYPVGESVSVSASISNGVFSSAVASYSGTVETGLSEGTATYTESDHGTYIVTPDGDDARCFLRVNDEVIEVDRASDGTFDVMVPLNTDAMITVVTSTSICEVELLAITSRSFVWSFGDGDWAVLDLGVEDPPTQQSTRSRNYESYVTTGREFPATRFTGGGSRDVSVSGAVVDECPDHGTYDALIRLLDAGHAVFRNKRGEVINVAVTGLSDPLEHKGFTEVKVTQHQETV